MITVSNVKLKVGHNVYDLRDKISKELQLKSIFKDRTVPDYSIEVIRKSLDARRKPELFLIYSLRLSFDEDAEARIKAAYLKHRFDRSRIDISFAEPKEYVIPACGAKSLTNRPVIIGSGPAGMFAALLLSRRGFKPIIVERGECVDDRISTVEQIFNSGEISVNSNVQFGEGGAGTFSDGKLNTMTKDPVGRHGFIMDTFAMMGADESVRYLAKPHVGTDKLVDVVRNIRHEVIEHGGEYLFNTQAVGFEFTNDAVSGVRIRRDGAEEVISTNQCILAIGHSARDTFEMLYNIGMKMEAKDFAVGFRVSHLQSTINKCQYGSEEVEGLGAADYKFTHTCQNGRRVYSFCMCPGGYVVNASSEQGRMAVNGMSYYDRASGYANSAIVCAVTKEDYGYEGNPLSGMYYQRDIEEKAYEAGGGFGCIPVQRLADYIAGIKRSEFGRIKPMTKGTCMPSDLNGIFSKEIKDAIVESIEKIGYTMEGFADDDTLLFGVESRTSSPIRIPRNNRFQADYEGLYPCGEGAGYAGGITSAAADGMKVAEYIIENYYPDYN